MDLEQNDGLDHTPVESLTAREIEILGLYAAGYNNPQVAEQLFLAGSTVKWYARQIYGKLGVANRAAALSKARSLGYLAPKHAAHGLPAPLTPLIGRQPELQALERALADPGCRLLTITGPGGIGKTRLALQVGGNLTNQPAPLFRDGVCFVRLEPVSNPITALADALQLQSFQAGEGTRTQLIGYLKNRQILCLLDNFEPFVGSRESAWLAELLTAAPGLKLLVTSRMRLNLAGEQVYPLAGLDLPPESGASQGESALEQAAASSSIRLFLQAARRNRPNFELSQSNLAPVQQICRLLDGMPLGIELAAGWIGALSPQQIQAEMQRSFDFLESPMQDVPDRQRSLRAVFETSWQRLSEQERAAAMRLVVFQGGFDYPAARQLSGLSPQELLGLVNKSWLQLETSGRYHFYDPLRGYIEEIARQDQEWELTCDDHSRYFCNLAATEGQRLFTFDSQKAAAIFRTEMDNLRAAWNWAVRQERWSLIEQAVDGLCSYFNRYSRYEEAAGLCAAAIAALSENAIENGGCLLAHLLVWQATFSGDPAESSRLLARAQGLLEAGQAQSQPSYLAVKAHYLKETAQLLSWRDRPRAQQLYQESLALYQTMEEEASIADVMTNLGWLSWSFLDLEASQNWFEASLKILERTGDRFLAAKSLNMLGLIVRNQGRYREAERRQREALALFAAVGSHLGMAEILYVLPYILLVNGQVDQAETFARQSLAEYERMGYQGPYLAKPYVGITTTLLVEGEYQQARAAALQGLTIAEMYGNQQESGIFLMLLGRLDLIENHADLAREHFAKSYQFFTALEHKSAIVAGAYLACLSLDQDGLERSRSQIKRTLASALSGLDTYRACLLLIPIILYLDRAGQPEKAAEMLAYFQRFHGNFSIRLLRDIFGPALVEKSEHISIGAPDEDLDDIRGRVIQAKLEELYAVI